MIKIEIANCFEMNLNRNLLFCGRIKKKKKK